MRLRLCLCWATLAVATLSQTGCATVDPKPFGQFSLAVQELRDGADGALALNNGLNRDRYIEQVAVQSQQPEGKDDVLNLFVDNVPNDPFGWQMKTVPLFMMSKRFASGVYNLNSALVTYAELLKQLAAPETISKEEFDDLARDLDAGLTLATRQLELDAADKGLALFSVAATRAAYAFIDHKRSHALAELVAANQANIVLVAERLQQALRLAAANLHSDYTSKRILLARQLTPGAKADLAAREKAVRQFVVLNEEYVARLEILRELNSACQALPNAHRELALAVKSPEMKLSSIRALAKNGQQLKKLYKELATN